jgi:phosphohistidine phosphatase
MGRWLRAAGYVPDLVLCSTACRTRETWELAQPALKATPQVGFERRIYEAPAAQLLDLVHQAPLAVKTLLVIGHAPGIPDLALRLAGAAPSAGSEAGGGTVPPAVVERMKAKFPTAAIAVLELTGRWDRLGPGTARLSAFVTPRDVSAGQPGSD